MTESSAALTESEPANEVSVIQVATVRFKNVKSVSDWLGLPREILLLNLNMTHGHASPVPAQFSFSHTSVSARIGHFGSSGCAARALAEDIRERYCGACSGRGGAAVVFSSRQFSIQA